MTRNIKTDYSRRAALAAAPASSKEYVEWVPVTERLPEPGIPVLLDIGAKYPIRAVWVAKFTTVATDNYAEWGEYDKDTDEYYDPEGWYEWNQTDETHWAVLSVPIHWMPLPAPPIASEAKGAT